MLNFDSCDIFLSIEPFCLMKCKSVKEIFNFSIINNGEHLGAGVWVLSSVKERV